MPMKLRSTQSQFGRKILSLLLAGLLLVTLTARPALASSKGEEETRFIEKVKAGIGKLGTGPDALVEIKLRDKTKLKGYVGEIGDGYFTVIDARTGTSTVVDYAQVKQAKGNNLSKGAKIAIGIAIVLGIVIAIGLIFGRSD